MAKRGRLTERRGLAESARRRPGLLAESAGRRPGLLSECARRRRRLLSERARRSEGRRALPGLLAKAGRGGCAERALLRLRSETSAERRRLGARERALLRLLRAEAAPTAEAPAAERHRKVSRNRARQPLA